MRNAICDNLDAWSSRWVQSEHKSDLGKFELSAGSFYGDAEKDKGIKTSQDAKFYGLSAKFDKVMYKFMRACISAVTNRAGF